MSQFKQKTTTNVYSMQCKIINSGSKRKRYLSRMSWNLLAKIANNVDFFSRRNSIERFYTYIQRVILSNILTLLLLPLLLHHLLLLLLLPPFTSPLFLLNNIIIVTNTIYSNTDSMFRTYIHTHVLFPDPHFQVSFFPLNSV